MALYVVLHHRHDPHQPWANTWEGSTTDRIKVITTTAAITRRAQEEGRVFVHRCGHGPHPPAIVCEARVLRAEVMDRKSGWVEFEPLRVLSAEPPQTPGPGTNWYEAAPQQHP